jgi:uncharacterized Fe-S cluster protein YjdI
MKEYSCQGLTVQWNPEKCIHAQECVKGLPQVFNHDNRPWINMQGASPEEIIKVIDRCPSGALTYKQDEPQPAKDEASGDAYASIRIVKNGPLLVEGNCRILDPEGEEVAKQGTCALCRCGSSRKKPFCDGSHTNIGFQDSE